MDEERSFIPIEGVNYECHRIAPRHVRSPWLVFLHEGLGCVASWKEFPREVARRTGCPVLSYSRRGYGRSDPRPLPWPLRFMHDEALDVLPKLLTAARIERAVLIGHSDGASIALIHAGAIADERIVGLVLLAPHIFVEDLTLAGIRGAVTAYEAGDLRERLARYHEDNVDDTFRGWSGAWLDPAFREWNLEEYPARIRCPVLLVQGRQDDYGTEAQLVSLRAKLPQPPRQLLLSDCGHVPFRDRPAETLQGIAVFVTGLGIPPDPPGR